MNDVLQDFSKASLTVANKANLFAYYDTLGRSNSKIVDYHDGDEFKWLLTGLSITFLNNILRTRLREDNVARRLDETLAGLSAKQVRYLTWWVEADAQPANLGQHLERRGLVYDDSWPAMAADLDQLDLGLASVEDFVIERVTDEAKLRQWVDVLLSGFELPLEESAACGALYLPLGFDLPMRHYIGYWDSLPVATSQLFLAEGVAGLYCVSTIKEARRRGIGAAMSMTPMLEAREMGYRIGILQASPLGAPVYQRMGFAEHAKFSAYYLVP